MLTVFKRWFRRAAPPAPPMPSTSTLPAEPTAPTSGIEAAPRVTAPYPSGNLAEHLRAQLVARVHAMREELSAADRDGDGGALLAVLLRSDDLNIRQLPAAAQEALVICNDPNASLQQLVPLFMKDPTLTQALLRQANAAYYGGGSPVVGLGEAMQRVGTGGVRGILLAATVQGMLCRPGGAFAEMASETWDHMGRTAPIARAVASALNANPDEAFALGLLHDVGKLVVFDAATALRTERRRNLRLSPMVVRRLLRETHELLGGLAVRLWGLGDPAALAVATHHRAPPPGYRDVLSETLYVAERADLAQARGTPLDLAVLWSEGQLSGSAVRVGTVLESPR